MSNTAFAVNLDDTQLCTVMVAMLEDRRLESTSLVGNRCLIKILTQLQVKRNKKQIPVC